MRPLTRLPPAAKPSREGCEATLSIWRRALRCEGGHRGRRHTALSAYQPPNMGIGPTHSRANEGLSAPSNAHYEALSSAPIRSFSARHLHAPAQRVLDLGREIARRPPAEHALRFRDVADQPG